jgi:hypothetical protein
MWAPCHGICGYKLASARKDIYLYLSGYKVWQVQWNDIYPLCLHGPCPSSSPGPTCRQVWGSLHCISRSNGGTEFLKGATDEGPTMLSSLPHLMDTEFVDNDNGCCPKEDCIHPGR